METSDFQAGSRCSFRDCLTRGGRCCAGCGRSLLFLPRRLLCRRSRPRGVTHSPIAVSTRVASRPRHGAGFSGVRGSGPCACWPPRGTARGTPSVGFSWAIRPILREGALEPGCPTRVPTPPGGSARRVRPALRGPSCPGALSLLAMLLAGVCLPELALGGRAVCGPVGGRARVCNTAAKLPFPVGILDALSCGAAHPAAWALHAPASPPTRPGGGRCLLVGSPG